MNKEQINFLKNLKEEILTQDNLATRDVMFAVLETKEHYNIDSDCCDYQVMVGDGDTVYRDIDDVIDNFPDFEEELKDLDLEGACDYLFNEGYDVRICGVKEVEEFNFMNGQSVFFTSKACKEFIKNNKHNLSSPVCYGISSWNNPEMNALREVIISTDWDKLQDSDYSLRKNNVKMLIDAIEYQGEKMSNVQKQILEKLTFDNATNYNFELIVNMSKDFVEYDFYTALFESEIITDYFDKVEQQAMLNWIKGNNLLKEYEEYDGVLTPFEFISEDKDNLEKFLKDYFEIVE